MKVYELVNPSDPYTFRAPNLLTAGIVAVLLGNGAYGAVSEDQTEKTPLLGGWEAFFESQGIKTENLNQYLDDHVAEIAEALDSMLIGGYQDRKEIEELLVNVARDKHREFLEKRHEARRSSMNNIGGYAWKLAKRMRETLEKEKAKV